MLTLALLAYVAFGVLHQNKGKSYGYRLSDIARAQEAIAILEGGATP